MVFIYREGRCRITTFPISKKSPIFHLTGVQYGRFFLYDFIFHIYKLCIPWQPYQLNGSNGAVTLFGNNDLGNILFSVSL